MATLVDSNPETQRNSSWNLYTPFPHKGQSFYGDANFLDSCKFNIYRTGNPSGNVYAKLYLESHDTAFGTDSEPIGEPLATSDPVDVSTIPQGSYNNITFTFSGQERYHLSNGVAYIITCYFNGGASGNLIYLGADATSPNHEGNSSSFRADLETWSTSSNDICFYVYSSDQKYTVSIIDNILISALPFGKYIISILEQIQFIDIITPTLRWKKAFSDQVSLSEAINKWQGFKRSVSDSVVLSETISTLNRFIKNLTDAISLTETFNKISAFKKSLSDSVSLNEVLNKWQGFKKSVSDSISMSETVSAIRRFVKNLTDAVSLRSIVSTATKFKQFVSDTIHFVETITVISTGAAVHYTQTILDNIATSEVFSEITKFKQVFSEQVSLTESFSKMSRFVKSLSDAVSLTETINTAKKYLLSFTDTIVTVEDLRFGAMAFAVSVSETLRLTEAISVFSRIWTFLTKHTSSWVFGGKSSAPTWTNQTKNTSTWSWRNKNK